MFPMRLVFLAMATAMVWSNSAFGREANDAIDEIRVEIGKMQTRLDGVEGKVWRVIKREEQTEKRSTQQ